MTGPSRRRFLAGLAAAGSAGLAGCLGDVPSVGGDATTPDGIRVETLEVGGSTGATLPLRPASGVALVDFFATWCAPCKPQMATLRSVRERFPDLHMLSISWEEDEAAIKRFWRQYDGTWPVAMDPSLRTAQELDVKRVPTLLVLGPDGEERWRHSGLAAEDSLVQAVRSAREGT